MSFYLSIMTPKVKNSLATEALSVQRGSTHSANEIHKSISSLMQWSLSDHRCYEKKTAQKKINCPFSPQNDQYKRSSKHSSILFMLFLTRRSAMI